MMKQVATGDYHFHDYTTSLGIEAVQGKHVTQGFPRHTHRKLCIGIVEHGVRIFFCRGTRYTASPGQIFVIPPNEAHSCGPADETHTYRLLLVSSEVLRMILPKLGNDGSAQYKFNNLVFANKMLYDQFLNFHLVLEGDETFFVKQSMLLSTIGGIVEWCVDVEPCLPLDRKQQESVIRAQTFIDDHYAESFSLSELAENAYLSPYYFIRVFSRATGLPPHIYQQQVRIRHAKELLIQGVSLADVANQTGFTDQSHFSNVFKKTVGVTPGEYRRGQDCKSFC